MKRNSVYPSALNCDDNIKDGSRGCDIVEEKIRRLLAARETWDRKMKRKCSMGTVVARSIDGEGEQKKLMHLRLANESGPQGSDAQGLSLQNWIEDLYWKQHDINYPGMDDAIVHRGFYTVYHNTTIRPAILDAVERAKKFYGDFKIIATGHSMGGAMASFCGLDLTEKALEHLKVTETKQLQLARKWTWCFIHCSCLY